MLRKGMHKYIYIYTWCVLLLMCWAVGPKCTHATNLTFLQIRTNALVHAPYNKQEKTSNSQNKCLKHTGKASQ